MARLGDKAPNLRFLILGDGAERPRLTAMAKELGLENRVTLAGGVPIEQVARTMANVDLGVEPKRKRSFANEALSTKIPEFMAMGVPVLASDTRTHQFYFKEGMVRYFESEDVDDLASKILELMKDPAKCNALRQRGDEFIKENNWDARKHEYLDLVERLVGAPSAASVTKTVRNAA
jgi:glycosyltransferase involved in cell wall biosynthesis